ncbi:MAG: type II toxin-antitoxin system RelE/ParE family toxin [Terracidiphilus sp.]|nr:type II toxin-antitoxin system RelE/ParE family toxin [Terracidiphilus sp.]MDR3775268.1 type II toxin-antitoxin system RelE/ParE family toxin [Terracidiphilus sp.]
MKHASISREAEADIDQIAAYTTDTWGWVQSDRYLGQLEDSFQLLANNPSMGRSCDAIREGLHRFEIGKHVVFYRTEPDGILIARVLHQQMVPAKAQFEP